MAQKTADGLKFRRVENAWENAGGTVRDGRKHPRMLLYAGLRPIPLAKTTDARRMIAPYLAGIIGTTNMEAYARFA
jgi:hypothetical protein